jgi:hypothetical protein
MVGPLGRLSAICPCVRASPDGSGRGRRTAIGMLETSWAVAGEHALRPAIGVGRSVAWRQHGSTAGYPPGPVEVRPSRFVCLTPQVIVTDDPAGWPRGSSSPPAEHGRWLPPATLRAAAVPAADPSSMTPPLPAARRFPPRNGCGHRWGSSVADAGELSASDAGKVQRELRYVAKPVTGTGLTVPQRHVSSCASPRGCRVQIARF